MVIRLFCAAGMSTSLLVKKMEEAAKEKGKDADIAAYPFTEMERVIEGVDVALLGPQVGYQLGRAKEICEPKGVPVDVIPMQDYLGLDNHYRMNKPSTVGENWKWRLKKGELTDLLKEEIRGMTRRYGRLNGQ